jgi:uncharacterized membrane protein
MHWLAHIFAPLCSQANCWTLDGQTLPFCQRCTGLYVGATLALLGYWLVRPRPTPAMLWAHGLLLLAMVPFGYHLVPQNGTIRTLTGQLFAVGLVGYLSLLPSSRLPRHKAHCGAKGGTSLSAAKGVFCGTTTPFVPQGVPPKNRQVILTRCLIYAAASLAAVGLVQAAVHWGGQCTAVALGWCGLAGLLVLGALTLANLVLMAQTVLRAVRFGRGADGP